MGAFYRGDDPCGSGGAAWWATWYNRRWLLKEGSEFPIRFVEGRVAEVVFPVSFVDEVAETGNPSVSGHASNVVKEAKLACGLTILVPLFIKVGERVSVDTETQKYLRRESGAS